MQNRYSGVGIAIRNECKGLRIVKEPESIFPRILFTTISIGGFKIKIVTCYVPSEDTPYAAKAQFYNILYKASMFTYESAKQTSKASKGRTRKTQILEWLRGRHTNL